MSPPRRKQPPGGDERANGGGGTSALTRLPSPVRARGCREPIVFAGGLSCQDTPDGREQFAVGRRCCCWHRPLRWHSLGIRLRARRRVRGAGLLALCRRRCRSGQRRRFGCRLRRFRNRPRDGPAGLTMRRVCGPCVRGRCLGCPARRWRMRTGCGLPGLSRARRHRLQRCPRARCCGPVTAGVCGRRRGTLFSCRVRRTALGARAR